MVNLDGNWGFVLCEVNLVCVIYWILENGFVELFKYKDFLELFIGWGRLLDKKYSFYIIFLLMLKVLLLVNDC